MTDPPSHIITYPHTHTHTYSVLIKKSNNQCPSGDKCYLSLKQDQINGYDYPSDDNSIDSNDESEDISEVEQFNIGQVHVASNRNDKYEDENWFNIVKYQSTENINNFLSFLTGVSIIVLSFCYQHK